MNLNISTTSLRALIVLTEKREKLTDELATVEKQITSAIGGTASKIQTPKIRKGTEGGNGRTAKAPKKRAKRGAVKELILAGLKEAGEAGIAVKHLAVKLGIKPQNIHVWLHTTGKKGGFVKALGKGVYRLEESIGVATAQSSLNAPKPEPIRMTLKVRKKKTSKKKQ